MLPAIKSFSAFFRELKRISNKLEDQLLSQKYQRRKM
jgi:hypothetical protein